jgi:Glyoxalase-like domain
MATIGELDWVHVFIDVPPDTAAAARGFWSGVLGWAPGEPWDGHPEFTSLLPPDGHSYVHVQEVHDDPRVHVDVEVDDLDAARDRLADLGARSGMRTRWWQVMHSPAGLPFCLCYPSHGPRPPGTLHPGGHRSRLAQVCIDAPHEAFDAELAFWQQATGWHVERSGRPEFTDLVGPPEATLRLLLQRLGEDDPGATARAHIDLGSDDIDAEADRLTGIGARYLDRYPNWALLTDPAGLPFCVTGVSPQ